MHREEKLGIRPMSDLQLHRMTIQDSQSLRYKSLAQAENNNNKLFY
jgi:hypothetical protein